MKTLTPNEAAFHAGPRPILSRSERVGRGLRRVDFTDSAQRRDHEGNIRIDFAARNGFTSRKDCDDFLNASMEKPFTLPILPVLAITSFIVGCALLAGWALGIFAAAVIH